MTTIAAAMKAAHANGIKIKIKPGSVTVAIICQTCGYGTDLSDQNPKSYAERPYSCDHQLPHQPKTEDQTL